MTIETQIEGRAQSLGFTLCGFTPIQPLQRKAFVSDWLQAGNAGDMHYLERNLDQRIDPRVQYPRARSIICLGFPYSPPRTPQINWRKELRGRIAAYAIGPDYHHVLNEQLAKLVCYLKDLRPGAWTRPYVDTGPVLEREWAFRGGLGWFGKNTMIIRKSTGSWFFLAEILTDLDLQGSSVSADHCGTCTQCKTECPTNALDESYKLKPPLCISYLTIEHRGAIPYDLRPKIGNWIFGCDICQEVCPWNNKFAETQNDHTDFFSPSLSALMTLDEKQFRLKFRNSPITRTKRKGLLRNVAVALGNTQNSEAIGPLVGGLADHEPLIRQHVVWALGRLHQQPTLKRHLEHEKDNVVRQEILSALGEIPR